MAVPPDYTVRFKSIDRSIWIMTRSCPFLTGFTEKGGFGNLTFLKMPVQRTKSLGRFDMISFFHGWRTISLPAISIQVS